MVKPEAKRQRIYVILNPLEQVLQKRLNNLKLSYQNDTMIKMSDAVFSCLSKGIQMEKVIFLLCMQREHSWNTLSSSDSYTLRRTLTNWNGLRRKLQEKKMRSGKCALYKPPKKFNAFTQGWKKTLQTLSPSVRTFMERCS